jgi:RNA polymerase sigma factor (sigma-70 family)
LLERFALARDADAFETLVRRHGPMVLGVCRRVTNDAQEAEDAFQATFMVLVRKAGSLSRPELLGNWLYGVAYRIAQKARARLARRRHHERRVDPMLSADPDADLLWQELRSVLDQELKNLPPKYRAPLVLCYLEGMTNEEAARRLGWPAGSMSYRLARGRQMLRERLRDRRHTISGALLLKLLKANAGPEEVPAGLVKTTLDAALTASGRRPPIAPPVPTRTPVRVLSRSRVPSLLVVALILLGTTAGVLLTYTAATGGFSQSGAVRSWVPWLSPPPDRPSEGRPSDATPVATPGGSCH